MTKFLNIKFKLVLRRSFSNSLFLFIFPLSWWKAILGNSEHSKKSRWYMRRNLNVGNFEAKYTWGNFRELSSQDPRKLQTPVNHVVTTLSKSYGGQHNQLNSASKINDSNLNSIALVKQKANFPFPDLQMENCQMIWIWGWKISWHHPKSYNFVLQWIYDIVWNG